MNKLVISFTSTEDYNNRIANLRAKAHAILDPNYNDKITEVANVSLEMRFDNMDDLMGFVKSV